MTPVWHCIKRELRKVIKINIYLPYVRKLLDIEKNGTLICLPDSKKTIKRK